MEQYGGTGYNGYGQLGNGTTTNETSFHKVKLNDNGDYLENIVQITAASNTAYALTADGYIYSWGLNYHGNFGINAGTGYNANPYPVKMQKMSNIIQISAGESHISMLDADGSVWSVGANGNGQFGVGDSSSRSLPIQMKDTDGKVLYGVKEIAAGIYTNIILKEDGSVWATGYNGHGELGDGTTTGKTTIVPVLKVIETKEDGTVETEQIKDAKHISSDGYTTYISRQKDSSGNNQGMYVCGYNGYGQLFTEDTINRTYATEVETDKDILTMASTRNTDACVTGAIADQDGMVYTVGYNASGEMGNKTVENLIVPWCISEKKINVDKNIMNFEHPGETDKINYNSSMKFNLIQKTVPGDSCTFESLDEKVATVDENGVVTAQGQGSTIIKLHNAKNSLYGVVHVNVNGEGNITAPKLFGGANHMVALKANGTVWTWGYNNCGQLGLGDTTSRVEPEQMKATMLQEDGTTKEEYLTDIIDITAGYNFTLVLRKDGTVWATGYNGYGQIGNGNTTNGLTLTQVKGENGVGYLQNIVQLAASGNTAHALSADGHVYSWGINYHGNFGTNNGTGYGANYYPVEMQKVSNIIQITAGDSHISMLDADGSVWSVGYNGNGQFGIGDASSRSLPIQMKDIDGTVLYGVKEIASGTNTTTIIKEDGSVWATGYNGHGEIGDGTTTGRNTIVPVLKVIETKEDGTVETEQIKDAKHVSAAGYTTYISRQNDEKGNPQGMYVCGYNAYGQLFTEDITMRQYATEVQMDKDILTMTSTRNVDGYVTGAIADQDGKVYTVGYNGNGEMGNGTVENLVTPWCISKLKIETNPKIINFKNIGETSEQITQEITMEFNLIKEKIEGGTFTYSSVDEKIATVDENGIVTSQGIGTTFIKVYNKENDIWGAVRINVNGPQGQVQPKIVGGANHFVALRANGTAWTWGYNNCGQLGTGDTTSRVEPVQMKALVPQDDGTLAEEYLTDIIDVATGYNFTLVLRRDGTVWATGYNGYGQIGNGNTTNGLMLTQVKGEKGEGYLQNIVQIAGESNTSHALSADGYVYSWGINYYGNFGINNGTGYAANYYPVKMQKVSNIMQIAAGDSHISMLDADGSVWSVGYNGYGHFGVGDGSGRSLPIQMKDTDGKVLHGVKEITAGVHTTTIIKEDGTVWAVGYNGHGEIGDGTTTGRSTIVPVLVEKENPVEGEEKTEQIKDAKHLSSGGWTTYISRQNDEKGNPQGMYVCGYNGFGQLFTQDKITKTYVTKVETEKDILTMSSTRNTDGYVTGAIADIEGNVYTVGYNGNGEMGNGTVETTEFPVCISQLKLEVEPSIIDYKNPGDTGKQITCYVSAGFNLLYETLEQGEFEYKSLDEDVALVDENGIVTAAGQGETYIRVYNKINNCYGAVKVRVNGKQGKTQAKIVGGANHFVALRANGEVWTWGYNGYGQLGIGDNDSRNKPTKTSIYDEKDNTQSVYAIDVAAGYNFTVVLKSDGTVWTTGYNGYGCLGEGTTTNTNTFTQVKGENGIGYLENIVEITANNCTAHALSADGHVYSWGINYHGNFGVNYGTGYSANPYPVKMQKVSNIIQISAGDSSIVMLDADGTAWGVGYNGYGALGTGDTSTKVLPQKIRTEDGKGILTGIKKVVLGAYHTIVLKEDGTALAIGYNGYGELANGTTENKILPTPMLDEDGNQVKNIKDIAANGYDSLLSIKPDDTGSAGMYVAGYNNFGQLYTKDTQTRSLLQKVETDKNLITLTSTQNAGAQTSAIADDLGVVYTVGYNGNGEMGDERWITSINPISISDERFDVETQRIILNLGGKETEQIIAATDLGFNLLYSIVEDEEISYKSLDPNIATVDSSGLVKAVSYGTTKIEVTTNKLPNKAIVIVEVLRKDDIAKPKMVSGRNHTVALKADGTVWTWGYNGNGQLGLGDTSNRYKPTKVTIDNVIDIAAGDEYTLVLTRDGKVYSWGANGYGQLARTGDTTVPSIIDGLDDIIQISASTYNAMALTKNGNIYTWGYNGNGQLGNNGTASTSVPTKIRAKGIIKIAGNNQTSAAIDGDGNVYTWGYNGYGQLGTGITSNVYEPTRVLNLENIVDVDVEENTVLAVDKDGYVYSSGYNGYGNLGNGNTNTRYTFEKVVTGFNEITTGTGENQVITQEPVYLSNIKAIEAGYYNAVAVSNEGKAYNIGYNGYGQNGNGNTDNNLVATEIKYGKDLDVIDEVYDVAVNEGSLAVARQDGKVWTIGKDNFGQMGDNSTQDKKEFVCISNSRVQFEESPIRIKGIGKTKNVLVDMVAGFNLFYNTVENKNFKFESRNTKIVTVDENTGIATSVKKGKTTIKVTDTISGETASVDVYVLGEDDITFPQIESYNYSTVTLRANGEVWSYGYNGNGQLGTGDRNNKLLPTNTGIKDIVEIALGDSHTVALDKDGHVWAWGYNGYGQLGTGDTQDSNTKVQVKSPDGQGYLENIVSVAAGYYYSMALDKDGNVYTWGYNGYGNLGLGDGNTRLLPVKVDSLGKIRKIAAGNVSSFAIDNDNNLWVAGYNGNGNLGDGTTQNRVTFVKSNLLTDVADVKPNQVNGTIVLLLDGTVWGMGYNSNYALTNVGGPIPQQLQGPDGDLLHDITSIDVGYYSGYAITSEEKVLAWGLNNFTQLANGNTESQSKPVYMKDKDGNDFTDAMIVTGGIYNTELAKTDGTVWSIGYNGYGELGDGSTVSTNELKCISVPYITLAEREKTLKLSNPQYQISPETTYGFNLLYDKVTNEGFTYTSLNSDIAEVNKDSGLVTAKSLGRTYVVVKSNTTEDETRVIINVIDEDKKTEEKVATGHIHSLALKQDGTIWTWGDNSEGEIGNGVTSSVRQLEPLRVEKGKYTEVKVQEVEGGEPVITTIVIEKELNDMKDIAAGYYYNLAVESDGHVWAWGYNGYGQLGDGTTERKTIPTRVEGLENIQKVYISGNTSYAINTNGEIYAWGYGYGAVPTKVNFYSKAIEITGKIVLSEDGTVWTLGSNPVRIEGIRNIVQIASGDGHYAALDTEGNVAVWGYNGYGQLAQGNTDNIDVKDIKIVKVKSTAYESTLEDLENIVEIVSGNNSLLMLDKNGHLYVSGHSGNGQLSTEKAENIISTAVRASNADYVKHISTNAYHTVVSDKDGFVYTAGYNGYGQLGDGSFNDKNILNAIGDTYVKVDPKVVTVEVNEKEGVSASLDNKFNLITDVVDSQNIEFESLNTDIATIDNTTREVTGKQIGKVEIIARHTVTNKTASIFVNVVPDGKVAVPEVETTNTHAVALKADGTVWTWGDNSNGQLGTGDNISKTSPVKVTALEGIIDISAGYYDTVCVKDDGTVWSFGHNGYGQLGDGTGSDRNEPVQVKKQDGSELKNIIKVAAGTYRTVALDTEGYVWIWGNEYGNLAVKLDKIENIIDISPNYVVNQTGKVIRINDLKQLDVENIIRVSEGKDHVLFLTKDGKGYSLGNNSKGQLGIGTTVDQELPVAIRNANGNGELTDIKQLTAGNEFSMAQTKNGKTYVWGSNNNYKLATMQTSNNVLPQINNKIENVMFIDAGVDNGTFIDNEGFVYAWGLGQYGVIGNKLYNSTSSPTLVGREDVGLNSYNITIQEGEDFKLTVTNKTFNVLKDVEDDSEKLFTSGNTDIATVSNDGLVTGIKPGYTSILVNKVGTSYSSIAQVTVLPKDVEIAPMALTCGSHTVVLKANGTVWSYGINSSYELGNGSTKSSDVPVKVQFPEGIKIKQIAVGNTHNLAIDTDGNLWGWGSNSNYALGTTSSVPVQLGLKNIKKISANSDQSMALTEDGYVYVWGLNVDGQLGTRNYETVKTPLMLPYVNDIIDISLGKNHSMMLKSDGTVLTTGLNTFGQTGKQEGKSNVFENIILNDKIAYISAGDNHSVLLTISGEVYTFGYNINGQLGNGKTEDRKTPTKVEGLTNIMQVSAGKGQTIILGANRKLYSTGNNEIGQLGIGNNTNKLLFTEITDVDDMMTISTGNTYSVAIRYDGDVYGWGDYYHGLQPIKTKTNSRIPVKIGNDSSYANEPEITLNVNGTKQIEITPRYTFNVFKDEDEKADNFEFEAINSDIATVDNKGIVTGKKVGVTWVKAIETATGKENVVIVRVIGEGHKYAPQVAGGDSYAAVLKSDGSIWSFGYNSDGQLGNDKLVPINIPSQANILSTYKKLVAGQSYTMAIREDGTVWAWGDNTYGVLGQGNRTAAKKPIEVQSLKDIVDIAAGENHVIALDKLGNMYTWGLNSTGQLGNGETKTVTVPEKINGVGNQVISIAAGKGITAIVDASGNVYVFGDNSSEQIARFECDKDQYGNDILPARNLMYTAPQKLFGITDAVKVEIIDESLVILKTDGSIVKVSKYMINNDSQIEEIASGNMVDISGKDGNLMAIDRDGNFYTYGANMDGQAGVGTTGGKVSLSKIADYEDKTYLSIGSGYKNNYVIDTEGFVYAAGDNIYGQLGNSTYDNSNKFTLVGDRNFLIIPETRTMKQPEEETVKIESNVFNVFNNNQRKLTDYDWSSSNTDVATVDKGVITAQDMGSTTITATDKATGATATALRVVQPLDEQRLDTIKVNDKVAEMSGENKYEVSVVPNKDGTGTLVITTKDATDQISIDNGANYQTGVFTQDIPLPINPTKVKIKVLTTNNKTVDYILTINLVSEDASLKSLTVNGMDATPIGSKEYEVILDNGVTMPEIMAIATHSNAMVSINNARAEKKQTTRTVNMVNKIKLVVPIIVTAQSGARLEYTLTIYKEDALTELESVSVNGVEATKIARNTYKALIKSDVDASVIVAKALYDDAEVQINKLGPDVKVTTRTVATIGSQTIVKIYVTAKDREREYRLIIDKEGTENDLALFSVSVGGNIIQPNGNIYDAYVTEGTTSINVTAITVDNDDIVEIDGIGDAVHEISKVVNVSGDVTTYTIYVKDPFDETNRKEYTLNIKKPSADDTLKSVTVGNKEFSREAVHKQGTDTYEVSIPEEYDVIDVIAVTNYELSKVSVDGNEYEVNTTTKQVSITGNPTEIEISVKTQNETIRKYKLIINRQNSSKDLLKVTVDGNEATLSKTAEDTYEYTLNKHLDELTIGAVTVNEKSSVAINTFDKEVHATYRKVKMQGKSITVYITVTAEDGTSKEYRLIVHALPDNIRLEKVTVNTVDAKAGENNTYIARVDKDTKILNIYAQPEDPKAKVSINGSTAVVGSVSATIPKNADEVKVKITVTGQDGTTGDYTLIIQNKSDDAELAVLKVDGEIIKKNENDGKYYVNKKYLTQSVTVEAIANNKLATVSINSTTPELEKQTSIVTTPAKINYINIVVTAEDGTAKTYTLVVTKLSNDTEVEISRIVEILGVDTKQKIDFKGTKSATIKIGNDTSVDLNAKATDIKAEISMNGSIPEKGETTQKIITTEERTTVIVEVVAQDGTKDSYTVILVRSSTDNILEKLEADGISKDDIIKTSDNSYKIEMPDTMDSLDLTATARNEFATVKINDGNYSTTNVGKDTVQVEDVTKVFEIVVKAESGEERVYEITVVKVVDLNLKEVKANGIDCVLDEGIYRAFIDADTKNVGLSIVPKNVLVELSTKVGNEDWSDSQVANVHTLNINTKDTKDITILVKVQDQSNPARSKIHTIVIAEKSHDASLELLKVDGKNAIKKEEGKYYAITTMDAEKALTYVKATNKYANVELVGIDSKTGEITKDIALSTAKVTTVSIKITAQDGKTVTNYTLEIERKSDDIGCDVTVNTEATDEYDESTNTFTKYIERDVEKAIVAVTTHSETSTVEMLGEIAIKVLSKEVSIVGETTSVDFKVQAENGDIQNYRLNIVKKSTDNTIATVKVNDKIIEEVDGKYTAIVIDNGQDVQTAIAEVTSNNEKANIQIGDGSEWQEGIATKDIIFKDGIRKITFNINVRPQDSNTESLTKTLEVILMSDDNSILSVKNGEKLVTIYDEDTHTYTEYVDKTVEEVTLAIQATSQYTTLKVGELESKGSTTIGNIDVKDKEEVIVTFTAISETGKEQEYKVRILKMSDNANAEHIYVDKVDVIDRFENADDVPTYVCSIPREKDTVNIRVDAENEFADIRIGDNSGDVGISIKDIKLNLLENSITVPIVITSQDGSVSKTYNIMFIRISNNTKITWVEVNEKHIIENADGNYETTVKASQEDAKVKVTLDDILAKVTLGGKVEVGEIEETIILPEKGDTVRTITVTAQDGTISTHQLIIHKQVNDLGLDKVYLNGRAATKVDDTTFEIDVMKDTDFADIKAIAKKASEYVSISGNEKTKSENTYTSCSIEDGEVKIKVIAMFENEIDQEKEYTLIIKEKEEPAILDDLKVTIKVEEDVVTPDIDGKYIKVVPEDLFNADVWAGITSETSKVKIKDSNGETEYANPESLKNVSLSDDITEVIITVQNGEGTEKEYTLYIIKDNEAIDDAELKQLFADGVEVEKGQDETYKVILPEGDTDTVLKAIANNPYARVSIAGNVSTREENTETIYMGTETKKIVKVTVTSISGKIKEYIVNIEIEQDELSLDAVYLDGRIAKRIDKTTFEIDVLKGTTVVPLKAVTAHDTSNVKIFDGAIYVHETTYADYSLSNGTSVPITVYNADKTDSREHTLIIKEKTTTLEDLKVDIKVDGVTISPAKDGSYVVVVDTDKTKANVWAGVNSITSQVNIVDVRTSEETGYEIVSATKDVSLVNDTTEVTVKVKNGAGQEKVYTVYIIKNNENLDDVSLESLFANEIQVLPSEDGNYVIEIKKNINTVKLVATATSTSASVSIAGNIPTKHVNTESIDMSKTDKKFLIIEVTSVTGKTKEYLVEIHKEYEELDLESIYVDGRAAKKVSDNRYEIDIKQNITDVDIEAKAHTGTDYVQINENLRAQGTNIYADYPVNDDKTVVPVKVTSPDMSASKDYTLVINKTSDILEDLIPEIKVDGNKILPDKDGTYVAVVDSEKTESTLWAGVNSETSSVKIENGAYKTPSTSELVKLEDNETIRTVTVKNGSGDEEQHKVIIIKENNDIYNADLLKVIAGSQATVPGDVTKEADGTYWVEMKKTEDRLDLTAVASYEYALLNIDNGTWARGTSNATIDMTDIEEKMIIIKVESVSGIIKNYIVNIYKEQEELALREVRVDNRLATKLSDTEYTLDVVKGTTEIDIKAVLYNLKDEYVAIYDGQSEKGTTTYVDYKLVNGDTINIKVSNGLDTTADDYKEKVYTLKITYVDNGEDLSDLQLEIKVDNKVIKKTPEGIYLAEAEADADKALIGVKANSKSTKVKIDNSEYEILTIEKSVELPDRITKVKVYAVNGAGDTVEEEVVIVKDMPKITGKVITQAANQANQSATITVYVSGDRTKVIEQIGINPDGTYELQLLPGRTYDLIITKTSYLEYTVTDIELDDKDVVLQDISILAGDTAPTGYIEIDDLVRLNDNFGVVITEANKEKAIYDLNEDGVVDKLDRNILKKNYNKKATTVQWIGQKIRRSQARLAENTLENERLSEWFETSDFILPISCDYTVTSPYGERVHPVTGETKKHTGIDLGGVHHTEVLAVADGEVVFSGVQNAFGNCIEIKHVVNGETIYTFYAHMSRLDVKVGDKVTQGQVIGLEGGDPQTDPNPGYSTGHHLHFEIRSASGYGNDVDPNLYMNF